MTTALAFEHAQQLALLLGEAWATSGLDYLLREDDELAMRRPADLRSFASRFVTGKPYVVGVLAPAGPAPAIGRMLAQFNELLGPP